MYVNEPMNITTRVIAGFLDECTIAERKERRAKPRLPPEFYDACAELSANFIDPAPALHAGFEAVAESIRNRLSRSTPPDLSITPTFQFSRFAIPMSFKGLAVPATRSEPKPIGSKR